MKFPKWVELFKPIILIYGGFSVILICKMIVSLILNFISEGRINPYVWDGLGGLCSVVNGHVEPGAVHSTIYPELCYPPVSLWTFEPLKSEVLLRFTIISTLVYGIYYVAVWIKERI